MKRRDRAEAPTTAPDAPEADEGVWMDSDTVEDAYEAADAAELEPEPEDEMEDD